MWLGAGIGIAPRQKIIPALVAEKSRSIVFCLHQGTEPQFHRLKGRPSRLRIGYREVGAMWIVLDVTIRAMGSAAGLMPVARDEDRPLDKGM